MREKSGVLGGEKREEAVREREKGNGRREQEGERVCDDS